MSQTPIVTILLFLLTIIATDMVYGQRQRGRVTQNYPPATEFIAAR